MAPRLAGAGQALALLLAFSLLSGCAGYSARIEVPRRLYERGNFEAAANELQTLAEREDNDQLLYLMDLGLVHHSAKKYLEAIQAFRKAEALADRKDFTSVSEEVGSVVVNDDAKFYKGEDFEKILIHVYLALDYTLAGKWDEALVECRRVNRKLDVMIAEGQVPHERNAFAKYLSAALFESQGDWNNALVDYRQLRKWDPGAPFLGAPLLRLTDRLRMGQEFEQFQKEFPSDKNFRVGKDQGELIVIVEQGKAPVKIPSHQMRLVPVFSKRDYRSEYVIVRDAAKSGAQVKSRTLFNIEETAIRELNGKLAGIIAKKLAGVAAKEALGAGVAKASDSQLAGALTSLFLHLMDKADTRSWTTLPATLQIARMTLPAGRRDIELDMVDDSGGQTKSVARWQGVEIKRGKIAFLSYRAPD